MNESIVRYPNTPEGREMAVRLAGENGYWEDYIDFSSDDREATHDENSNEVLALQAIEIAARQKPEVFDANTIMLVREKLRQHQGRTATSSVVKVSKDYL